MTKRNQNRPGYKETKMGWIPEDWEIQKLGNIVTEKMLGANYPCNESEMGTPIMKMVNINRGQMNLSKIERIPSVIENYQVFILKYGDILFNTRNTLDLVGKTAIWKNELPLAIYNSNILKLNFNSRVIGNQEFANDILNSHNSLSQLRGLATGTTSVAAIYNRDLMTLKVPLPPLPEQKKIAEILSAWDRAIEQTRKLIDARKCLKKGLMQQLLTGRMRFPEFGKPVTHKGDLPDGWKECKLGECFKVRNETNPDLPLLSITSDRGVILRDEVERKDTSNTDKRKYKRILPGDIGYNTMRMWQGVSAVSNI